MNDLNDELPDTQIPRKSLLHPDNLRKGGVWGAVITTIASLGYAEIQRSENETLLTTNVKLVEMVQHEAIGCRDRIVEVYLSCHAKED
jgi:hypothetical protein